MAYSPPIDETRCKCRWLKDWHWHQCSRKPWKDGYCKQHHPDTVKARREKAQRDYEAKWKRREEARQAPIKEAYTRGAEAMREKAAQRLDALAAGSLDISQHRYLHVAAESIRALPVPEDE